ncbi:MAG: hypothetical protein ABUL44_03880 [Flavobacterium sp.]
MKKAILILGVLVYGVNPVHAQTIYNCIYEQNCFWNENSESYENCVGREANSSFEIDKGQTSIAQTLVEKKTIFRIKSKEKSQKKGVSIYLTIDEAGDKYYFVFNSGIKEVRVISKKEGRAILSVYGQNQNYE